MTVDCSSPLATGDLVHSLTVEGGILLQVVGVLAAASGAVPGLFRRTWTSLSFGVVGALSGGAGMAIPVVLLLTLYMLVAVSLPTVLPFQLVAAATLTGAYLVATGCLFGLAIGVVAGIVRASSCRPASVLVMTGVGIVLFLAGPPVLLVAAGRCRTPVFVAPYVISLCLYGLALGGFAEVASPSAKWFLRISGFLVVGFLGLAFAVRVVPAGLASELAQEFLIAISIGLGLAVLAYGVFNSPRTRVQLPMKCGAVRRAIVWAGLGLLLGCTLPFAAKIIDGDILDLALLATSIGLFVAFGNGEMKRWVNPFVKIAKGSSPPSTSRWKRIVRGFCAGFTAAWIGWTLLAFDYFVVNGNLPNSIRSVGTVAATVVPPILLSVPPGCAIALLYGYGGATVSWLTHLSTPVYVVGGVLMVMVGLQLASPNEIVNLIHSLA